MVHPLVLTQCLSLVFFISSASFCLFVWFIFLNTAFLSTLLCHISACQNVSACKCLSHSAFIIQHCFVFSCYRLSTSSFHHFVYFLLRFFCNRIVPIVRIFRAIVSQLLQNDRRLIGLTILCITQFGMRAFLDRYFILLCPTLPNH